MEQFKHVQTILDLGMYRRLRNACLEQNLKLNSAAAVVSATENEFTVETFDVDALRKSRRN